jgi:hypothetical protein
MGATSTDGYEHTDFKAERDGKFIGMMFNEDSQYNLSEDRAVSTALMCVLSLSFFVNCPYPCLKNAWIDHLKGEGFF